MHTRVQIVKERKRNIYRLYVSYVSLYFRVLESVEKNCIYSRYSTKSSIFHTLFFRGPYALLLITKIGE